MTAAHYDTSPPPGSRQPQARKGRPRTARLSRNVLAMRRDAPLGDSHGAAQGQCRQSTRHRNRDWLGKGIICSSDPAVSKHLSRDAAGRKAAYTPRTSSIGSRRSCSRPPREPRTNPGRARRPVQRAGDPPRPSADPALVQLLGLREDSPLAWLSHACFPVSVARQSGRPFRPLQEGLTPKTI